MKQWKGLFVIAVIVVVALFIVACSRAPSRAAIKGAATAMLQQRVPAPWWSGGVHCEHGQVAALEIQRVGSFDKTGKYWPVTIHAKGRCELQSYPTKQWRPFDGVGELALSRGRDGKWVAARIGSSAPN